MCTFMNDFCNWKLVWLWRNYLLSGSWRSPTYPQIEVFYHNESRCLKWLLQAPTFPSFGDYAHRIIPISTGLVIYETQFSHLLKHFHPMGNFDLDQLQQFGYAPAHILSFVRLDLFWRCFDRAIPALPETTLPAKHFSAHIAPLSTLRWT